MAHAPEVGLEDNTMHCLIVYFHQLFPSGNSDAGE